MADVTVQLNNAELQKLLQSAEVSKVVEAEAERMTRATGVPYAPDVYVGRRRVNAGARRKEK